MADEPGVNFMVWQLFMLYEGEMAADGKTTEEAEVDQRAKSRVALEEANRLKGLISSNMEEMKASVLRISQDASESVNDLYTSVEAMEGSIRTAVSTLKDEAQNVMSSGAGNHKRLVQFSRAIPIFILTSYYVTYALFNGFRTAPSVWIGTIVAGSSYLILWLIVSFDDRRLKTTRGKIDRSIGYVRHGQGSLWATKRSMEPSLKRIREGLESAGTKGQVLLSSVRNYVPHLEDFYSNEARLSHQEVFKTSLRNSLEEYQVEYSLKVDELFKRTSPVTDTEIEWLDYYSGRLSKIVHIPSEIIRLMYFDYVGDEENLKNVWELLRKSESSISSLSALLVSHRLGVKLNLDGDGVSAYGAIEQIAKSLSPFRISLFNEKYSSFIGEFTREKRDVVESLRDYQVKISQYSERRIDEFIPSNMGNPKRLQELFEFVSEELELPIRIVEIACYERQGDIQNRLKTWDKLRKDVPTLGALTALLVERRLIDVPSQYASSVDELKAFVARLFPSLHDFTLPQIRETVRLSFSDYELQKGQIFRTLKLNNIVLNDEDRDEFARWLPTDVSPNNVCSWLGAKTKIPTSTLLLFYWDYAQNSVMRKQHFLSMIDSGEMAGLSQVIFEHRIIPIAEQDAINAEITISNIELVISQMPDYDRTELQSSFQTYNFILNNSQELLTFLKEGELVGLALHLKFQTVVDLVSRTDGGELQNLVSVAKFLLSCEDSTIAVPEVWLYPIVYASLALFLASRGNSLIFETCTRCSATQGATKLLYQVSRMNDREESLGKSDRMSVRSIFEKTIDKTFDDYQYLEQFQLELSMGHLFPKISLMLINRLESIDKKIADKQELEEKLSTFEGAMSTFLSSRLQANVVLEALRMQLITAYMITNPSRSDVISGIIDDELPKVCDKLAEQDTDYQDFSLISEETLGHSTRVGIVPFGMEFDKFASLFEQAFQMSVSHHIGVGSSSKRSATDYSSNLIRIFPSEAYFKRVGGQRKEEAAMAEDHPIAVISRLVLKNYGTIEGLELIASIKGEADKTIAMRSLLDTFFDTTSTIYLMGENKLKDLLGGSIFVEYIKEGRFDDDLMAAYNCKTRSSLALTVHRIANCGETHESSVKSRFQSELLRASRKVGARLPRGEVSVLADTIFQILFDIGFVLTGIQ